jgi:hypothetical protein
MKRVLELVAPWAITVGILWCLTEATVIQLLRVLIVGLAITFFFLYELIKGYDKNTRAFEDYHRDTLRKVTNIESDLADMPKRVSTKLGIDTLRSRGVSEDQIQDWYYSQ